jgi:hypothetical protein
VYDVAEDGKTTTQLRNHLRRVTKENEELRAMMPVVARAPRGPALNAWADEMEKHAFQQHLAEDVKKALLVRLVIECFEPLSDNMIGPVRTTPRTSRWRFVWHTTE